MNFKTVENKYRPIPFWSWNEKLDTEETARQIRLMGEAGIGGFFMHARGGLQTKYMGDDWHDNIRASINTAKERDMHPWVYDEDGWPSGFGGGIVSGMGEEYQLKYLRIEEGDRTCDTTITHVGGYHLYYEVNPFYVDTMDAKVVKLFIDSIYQPYVDKYGQEIEGFFTDEPQVSRYSMPWSFVLPDAYFKRHGMRLEEHLHELFYPVGDYENTRFNFWKLITDLFSESYMKQVQDFCHANGLRLTGHLLCEETLQSQLLCHGAIMPHYEYFDIPGMDWLGKPIKECLTPLQVSSVAHQLGKKQILSETFAGCGHNVGHDELKGLYEWQMVHGITLLCQHLNGYSLRGLRKRDYPPALNYQQPWWKHYRLFNDTVSRIGKILTEGEVKYDTLLIHPQSSAWILFDSLTNEGLDALNDDLLLVMRTLEQKHILFHFGDETIMERHAYVDGKTLVIGQQRYTKIVLPRYIRLFENTERLLDEYRKNGGLIVTAEELPANTIVDNSNITYTERIFEDQKIYYFVNSNPTEQRVYITKGNIRIHPETGETEPFDGKYTFAPYESLLILDNGGAREKNEKCEQKLSSVFDLNGEWKITHADDNAMTLDKCDYWFDGEKQGENEYVLSVMHKALALERPVRVRLQFRVQADYKPKALYLVTETPDFYTLICNGKTIDKTDHGYFVDRSFRKLDIADCFKIGENIIEAEMDFEQSQKTYENIRKAYLFEVEKNRFTCERELENFYLVGAFGIRCNGAWNETERNAAITAGDFTLTAPTTYVQLANLEHQGFPFFAGSMTLEKEFDWSGEGICFAFEKRGVNCVEVKLNGGELGKLMWEPLSMELTPHLTEGRNRITLTLTNNLRNLLGPHHCGEEPIYTRPGSFQKDKSFWNLDPVWDENYCFAEIGLLTKQNGNEDII